VKRLAVSQAGQLLLNYLAAINAAGDDAEGVYKEAVAAIRERAEDVVTEIARMESRLRTRDYAGRWGLIYAASELHHPAALPYFRSVVLTPIPPEESDDPHAFSTVAEETILRTTAVDGAARLATEGHEAAIEALFSFLSVPSISVKRASVQGLLAVKQAESLRGKIEAHLCPEERFLLDIRPLDVNRATQITDPEADLSDEGRAAAKDVAPDLPDRAQCVEPRPSNDSPAVNGGKGKEKS
jgi:hypothetical protein